MKIPADFQRFLSNGENKERMFQLFEIVWATLDSPPKGMFVARKNNCVKIMPGGVENVSCLKTDHEEADSKIAYLLKHAQSELNSTVFIIRSCSGDVDIPVLLLGSTTLDLSRVYIDSGTGKYRQDLHLGKQSLGQSLGQIQREALLGMHAFTGNDYVSSFFPVSYTHLTLPTKA